MIKILCHRGYWLKESEKNSLVAFKRAFSLNLGIETDIRDYNGELVVSHNIAAKDSIKFEALLSLYKDYRQSSLLALNIKADGLQKNLQKALKKYRISNYFVFDMSLPEQLIYIRDGFNTFARQSEFEKEPLLYDHAKGVWLDEFKMRWINSKIITKHINSKKAVCIVSPELHKRDHQKEWDEYRLINKRIKSVDLMICTDFPAKAKEFFHG